MFLGSVADAAAGGGFGKPLMSDEAEVGGDDHNGNCNGNVDEIDAYNYNEDEDNGAIFASRDFKLQGEEHMVSRKEDDWVRTFAGVAGNVLEWYDFAVFGYFSDVLGDVFFPPHQDGHAAIVESFAVFGGAFFMRPIGGMLMGYIGDTYGSRRALTISIFLMAFPTFCMGCLPGYKSVGSISIVFLTIVRLLQGLSVGGQLMSSLVFTLERHPKSKWGLYGSYVLAAANLGTLLGGIVATVTRSSLSDESLRVWGWRIPFLCGIIVSFSGYYLKHHSEEDDTNHIHGTPTDGPAANPLKLAFSRSNIRSLLASSMVPLLWSAGFYLTFVWMAVYMTDLLETQVPHSFAVNSASLGFSVCILFPVAGWLSDKVGRKRVMGLGGILIGMFSPVMIVLIGSGNAMIAFLAQSFLGICLSLWGAPMMAWLAESFEPAARLTSVAIGYNVAQALGGGMSPAIATELVDKLGPKSPGFYVTIMASFSVMGLLFVAPRSQVHFTALHGDDEIESTNYPDNDDAQERGSDAERHKHEII